MERFSISVLAFLLVASYASATTIEGLCKDTYDASYCVEMLKPIITPSTDFKSATWHKVVIDRALVRAMFAKNFIHDHESYNFPDSINLMLINCVNKLDQSVNLIKKGNLDKASSDQEACYDSLDDADAGIMREFRVHVNEAIMASKIASDIITKI